MRKEIQMEVPQDEASLVSEQKEQSSKDVNREGNGATPNKDGPKDKKKRRGLKKRTKDRGHGTLNEKDTSEIREVNLNQLDLSTKHMANEFGKPGSLPDRFRKKRQRKATLFAKDSKHTVFEIAHGKYKLDLKHMSKFASFVGASKSVLVKIWVQNTQHSFSTKATTATLKPGKNRSLEFYFEVEENENVELAIQLTSQSAIHKLTIAAVLTKL